MRVAILFPGQGSQAAGMGEAFYVKYPAFAKRYLQVSALLGMDFRRLCQNEEGLLERTEYAQRAIVALSALIFDHIKDQLANHDLFLVGHSLGEYAALYAAGVFSLADCLDLVAFRGEASAQAAREHPGQMAAIIGGETALVKALCEDISQRGMLVQIANYNSPTQVVISGTDAGLHEFAARMAETKAKRLVPLAVPGPFHTQLMQDAATKLQAKLATIKKDEPRYPVIMNHDARVLDLPAIDQVLSRQLVGPVLFEQTVTYLKQQGIRHFIEIGPGSVLTNLIKKQTEFDLAMAINNPDDIHILEVLQ